MLSYTIKYNQLRIKFCNSVLYHNDWKIMAVPPSVFCTTPKLSVYGTYP